MEQIIIVVAQAVGLCLAYPHTHQKAAPPAARMCYIGIANGIYPLNSNIVCMMYLLCAYNAPYQHYVRHCTRRNRSLVCLLVWHDTFNHRQRRALKVTQRSGSGSMRY